MMINMIVGIISSAVHSGQHSIQQEEQRLGQFTGIIKYIKSCQVKFGNRRETVFFCEVPDDYNALIVNEVTCIDGWFFKLVNNRLERLN